MDSSSTVCQHTPSARPLRPGISGSSFAYLMPRELVVAAYLDAREGRPIAFDRRQNRIMVDFMREMMDAINDSPIAAMECYHSLAWDNEPILELLLDRPRVEFWSVHAPYGRYFDPSSPEVEGRDGALAGLLDSIRVARRLGAKVVVAHPGVDIVYDTPREIRLGHAADTIRRAAEVAGESGIKIGIEPMPKREIGNSLDEVLRLVEMIDMANAGITFDTNHVFPPGKVPELIRRAGGLIVNVHVSDQDGIERHWLPGDGKLDWHAVLAALKDTGFSGPLIYETHIRDAMDCGELVRRVVENYSRIAGC
ncbi:MAG: sugar phosphate isomerase/epimerase family protein [Armatimonadota bacterium]